MKRLSAWLTSPRAGLVAVALLIVIAIRAMGEFFRIGGTAGAPLSGGEIFYIEGALAAACAALAALALHGFGRHGLTVPFTLAVVVALIVWKVVVFY